MQFTIKKINNRKIESKTNIQQTGYNLKTTSHINPQTHRHKMFSSFLIKFTYCPTTTQKTNTIKTIKTKAG